MERNWRVNSQRFSIDWGGDDWVLDLGEVSPGLACDARPEASLLRLAGLTDQGRHDDAAFSPSTLVAVEHHLDRVEATFRPTNWGQMLVRGVWRPTEGRGIDLTVHLQADSVDELKSVEVIVESRFIATGAQPIRRWRVEPRDSSAIERTNDGREPAGVEFTVESEFGRQQPAPWVKRCGTGTYVELCHGFDLSRRLSEAGGTLDESDVIRSVLFGYALEKGVVIRGRFRGLWFGAGEPLDVEREERDFLEAPLPLGV
jgi:hypothetical protein